MPLRYTSEDVCKVMHQLRECNGHSRRGLFLRALFCSEDSIDFWCISGSVRMSVSVIPVMHAYMYVY